MNTIKYLKHDLPSLQKAKELCKFIKKPLNGGVVLLNCNLPTINLNGLSVDKNTQAQQQKAFNQKNGLLVVKVEGESTVQEGDRVILSPSAEQGITYSKLLSTEELYDDIPDSVRKTYLEEASEQGAKGFQNRADLLYKKYIILVVHPAHFSVILEDE